MPPVGKSGHADTPFVASEPQPERVRILLKQHAGKAAAPVVSEGARVKRGETVAKMNPGELGANLHASIGGRVARVTAEHIEIEA